VLRGLIVALERELLEARVELVEVLGMVREGEQLEGQTGRHGLAR
jgi:hypothetical protein